MVITVKYTNGKYVIYSNLIRVELIGNKLKLVDTTTAEYIVEIRTDYDIKHELENYATGGIGRFYEEIK